MSTDDTEIVSAFRMKLADKIGWQRYELWFVGSTRLLIDKETLTVETPSAFFQDWLRTHFRGDLEAVALEILGERSTVQIRLNESLPPVSRPKTKKRAEEGREPAATRGEKPDSIKNAGTRRRLSRKSATFDQFVVGPCNKLAYTSAQLASENLGSISPLVVHGPTGVGKTHLLESIRNEVTGHSVTGNGRRAHAVYLTAEQFTTLFLEALHGKGLPSFRNKYRGVDLLLIDDIHFLIGKRATLVELLYTIDTLQRSGRQLVLATDRPPSDLEGLGPELVARLNGGLVCKIESPDFATRQGIVKNLCTRMKFDVTPEIQTLVATHVSSHARALSGALNRLHATSLTAQRPVTRSVAEQALAELAAQSNRAVRLPDIQKAVCEVFGIEPESLQSKNKSKSVSHPRMLAMFLARKYTRAAFSEIGQYFGRRSHSTVISANKKVERLMSQQQSLQLADHSWNVEEALRRVEDRLQTG